MTKGGKEGGAWPREVRREAHLPIAVDVKEHATEGEAVEVDRVLHISAQLE